MARGEAYEILPTLASASSSPTILYCMDFSNSELKTVTVFNSELEKSIKYKIVGEDEADANAGKISYASPLAKNLIGKFEGDILKLETPSGFTEYEIEKVEYL